ncbi:MAG: hypothetical protein L3K26_16170, partial [Candidatus Hydrogenedentes bacterium]|nr:hypothetical protein [Candidatus Hydrogenedentota bacterium]
MPVLSRFIWTSLILCLFIGMTDSVGAEESEAPNGPGAYAISDPGVPRIIWNGPRTIRVYGHHVLLNGFRFSGHYTKPGGVVQPFAEANASYTWDKQLNGLTLPVLSKEYPALWVAVFAVAEPDEKSATIRFMPFIKVDSYDVERHALVYEPNTGDFAPDFWAGTDVLVCKENRIYSNRLLKIESCTKAGIVLDVDDPTFKLYPGDYVLPAPTPTGDYKYLRTLKLDYSPSIPTGEHGEWRNFVFSEGRTYSYHGNPFGDLKNPDFQEVDFSHHVSPLATGALGTLIVFLLSAPGGSAG